MLSFEEKKMIHKFTNNGYKIVLDVYSGSVHILDDISYELLDYLGPEMSPERSPDIVDALSPEHDTKTITDAYDELYSLYKDGLLFSSDKYLEFIDKSNEDAPIKAMCMHMAHDCNLRCAYCFAHTGDYGTSRGLMPLETAKAAIDFILTKSKDRKNIEIDFFGGEPLLNFDVLKETVRYANEEGLKKGKNFRFTVTTNGLLLDDKKIDFINSKLSNVVLSIDGRKEINDRIRTRIDGSGTYDNIIPKFKKLIDKRGDQDYYVRATFTKFNLDFSKDVMHLYEQGFEQLSAEPVVSEPTLPYALTEEDLQAIFEEYDRLSLEILEHKKKGEFINFFHFNVDLNQGPCVIKRLKGCGSGNEYIAVTPEGDIYPCHQFVGIADYKMGNVFDGKLNRKIKSKFADSNIYTKIECRKCWAKFYCSGGCNANNFIYNGDILKPHKLSCEMEKKRLECAIMIKAATSFNI